MAHVWQRQKKWATLRLSPSSRSRYSVNLHCKASAYHLKGFGCLGFRFSVFDFYQPRPTMDTIDLSASCACVINTGLKGYNAAD